MQTKGTNKLDQVLDPDFAQTLLDEGMTVEALASEFWVSVTLVKRFIKNHGLTVPERHSAKDKVNISEAAKLLEKGYDWDDLSEHFDTPVHGLTRYCRNEGLKLVFRRNRKNELIRVRESAYSERIDKMTPETWSAIEKMLYEARPWSEIADLLGTSTSYAAARSNANGLYSMYKRSQAGLFQIRENPRTEATFTHYVKVEEGTISK